MQSRARTGYGLSALAALVWASTSPGIRYLLTVYNVPSLTVALWRDVFMAVACVGVLLLFKPSLLRVGRNELRGYALVGTISIGLYHALWVFSIALNGAAVAIVLIYTYPTFVTFGAWLFFRERIRWPQIAALGVSLVGCVLLARAYDPAVLRVSWFGTLVGLCTGIAHAGYVLFSQRSVAQRSPWTSLTYTMVFGTLALIVLTSVVNPSQLLAVGATPAPWLILLALALGPTLCGYAIFTAALRYAPAQIASLITVLEAPISAMIAVTVLGEYLETPQIAGIVLILISITLPHLIRQPPTDNITPPAEATPLAEQSALSS